MRRPKRNLLDQPNEVVARYVRRATYRRGILWGVAWARRYTRLKLLWEGRSQRRLLAETLKAFAKQAAQSQKNGYEAMHVVFNIGLFFLIAERDIQAVKIDALTHPDPWKRNLSARVMLLTIHELDLDKVCGQRLRKALQDGCVPDDLSHSMAEALRAIRTAQSRARREFSYLRNSTIAHRDADAMRQYRDIDELDSVEIAKVAAEFYEGTRQFLNVLPQLIVYLSSWPSLINQISAKAANRAGEAQQL